MSEIFLNFARGDEAAVDLVAARLEALGYKVLRRHIAEDYIDMDMPEAKAAVFVYGIGASQSWKIEFDMEEFRSYRIPIIWILVEKTLPPGFMHDTRAIHDVKLDISDILDVTSALL